MPTNEIVLHRAEAMKLGRQAGKWKNKSQEMLGAGTALGAALAAGFARGKLEDANGALPLPVVQADAEAVIGFALLALGVAGLPDMAVPGSSYYVGQAGLGIACHYAGQVARKTAKAGSLVLVAGEDDLEDEISGEEYEVGADPEDALRAALSAVP